MSEEKEVTEQLDDENVSAGSSKKTSKKKKIVSIILLLLIVIGSGIGAYFVFGQKNESKTVKTDSKKVYSKYKMSGNSLEDFDLAFLKLELNNQNLIYSPLSIKYALAMLSAGSNGKTKEQIDAIIGDYKSKNYVNSDNMSFANAMFIRNTFKDAIKDSYVKDLKDNYNAEVIYDNFDNPNNINSWINNKTLGLINDLVKDVNDKNYYLVNALAIDMDWNKLIQAITYQDVYSVTYNHEKYGHHISGIMMDEFNSVSFNNNTLNTKAGEIGASINNYDIVKELGEDNIRATITKEYEEWKKDPDNAGYTEDTETFVNNYISELNENYKRIDYSTDFEFYDDENLKVFSKELKKYNGTTLEYIGIMPKNKSLSDFVKENDATSLNKIIAKRKTLELQNFEAGKVTKIVGGIPFFKYDYELNLINDLKALGVTDVFDKEKADLSNITDTDTFIVEAKHKANIEFSNSGIKAAAVTPYGEYGSTRGGFEHLYEVPVVIIDMTFNNPYLYLIRDKDSGEVLFIGTVYQPTENTYANAGIISQK